MTIEDGLEELGENKTTSVKQIDERLTDLRTVKPPFLLPVKEIVEMNKRFYIMEEQVLGAREYYKMECDAPLLIFYLGFMDGAMLYKEIRNSLDIAGAKLGKWNAIFEGVIRPELLESKGTSLTVPSAVHQELISAVNTAIKDINSAKGTVKGEMQNLLICTKSNKVEALCENIHRSLTDVYNTTNLLDIILLGRSLKSNLDQLNESFSIRMVPYIEHPRIPADKYVKDIEKIFENYEQGCMLSYTYTNGELNRLKKRANSSKKPLKKSLWTKIFFGA